MDTETMIDILKIIDEHPKLKAFLYSRGIWLMDIKEAYEKDSYEGILQLLEQKIY